jgi:hypothetical protein
MAMQYLRIHLQQRTTPGRQGQARPKASRQFITAPVRLDWYILTLWII